MDTLRPYGPGKFNTVLDAYVYGVSLDGGCDEEVGDCCEGGWYGIMRNGRSIFKDHDPFLEALTKAEQKVLLASVGVIMSENSQGFVHVKYYTNEATMNREWEDIQQEVTADEEEN